MESENHSQNLAGSEALEKLKELSEKVSICFFSTTTGTSKDISSRTRPMQALQVEDDGTAWFMTGNNSKKIEQISTDKHVELLFSDPAGSHYLALSGEAQITTDREKIKDLWKPLLKIWFDGPDDPNIALIKVTPTEGFYWDTKNNKIVQMAKMVAGMVTGKELDDSIEGNLSL